MYKLNNTVIKIIDEQHIEKVLMFWKAIGVEDATNFKSNKMIGKYCGIANNYFDNFSRLQVQKNNLKRFTLPDNWENIENFKLINDVNDLKANDTIIILNNFFIFK